MLDSLGGTARGLVWLLCIEKRAVGKEMRSKGKWAARTCTALSDIVRTFLLF